MLVSDVPARESLIGPRQRRQVASHPEALGRGGRGEAALPAQPGDQGGGAIGRMFARGFEAAEGVGEHRLQAVHGAPERNQLLPEGSAREIRDFPVELVDGCVEHLFVI